jgi:hypothetical protein
MWNAHSVICLIEYPARQPVRLRANRQHQSVFRPAQWSDTANIFASRIGSHHGYLFLLQTPDKPSLLANGHIQPKQSSG